MSKAISRDQELVRAAELKAALVAIVNSAGKKTTFNEIVELMGAADKIPKGYRTDNLRAFLTTLVKNELISSERDGKHTLYFSNDLVTDEEGDEKPVKSKRGMANIKIDLIKSSGRVRLELQGLFIEIGVVDK